MSHGHDVEDEILVPAFDQDKAVLRVEAPVELGLWQVEVNQTGRVFQRVLVVLELAKSSEDDDIWKFTGSALFKKNRSIARSWLLVPFLNSSAHSANRTEQNAKCQRTVQKVVPRLS